MENKDSSLKVGIETEENSKQQDESSKVSDTSGLNDCLNNNASKLAESGKQELTPADGNTLSSPPSKTENPVR
jgi:hypothetical protein